MQADKMWQAALGELQIQVSKANYNTWLKDSRGIDYDNGVFTVAVPSVFIAEWLKGRLYSVVCRILSSITGRITEVVFQVQAVNRDPAPARNRLLPDGGTSVKERPASTRTTGFNTKFTFDTYVSGECNLLPYTASLEIAENPGGVFNPLYIYGGTGTGKTHLLHAIGQAARSKGLNVLYMSAEQFTNEFVVAIRNKKAEEFRGKFSRVDVFLLDDIQFLSGKNQTQECIFHIINDFLSDNRQIAISCDRPPKEIESLNVRLRSRLEGGLVADIYPPDHKTRLAILDLKSSMLQTRFDDDVLNILATNFHGSVRVLEGALIRLSTYSRMNNSTLDVSAVKTFLNDMIAASRQSSGQYTAADIINAVADYFAIPPDDITGKKRDLKTSRARHIVMYLLRQQNHNNLAEIGRVLGNRDHSTVIHGYDRIATNIGSDSLLSKSIEDIRLMLKSRRPS
jgi:chromosomal replication initiator protein